MSNEYVISLIANEVVRQLESAGIRLADESMEKEHHARNAAIFSAHSHISSGHNETPDNLTDIASYEYRHKMMDGPGDPEGMAHMMEKTSARIAIGKNGPRIRTASLLSLRADHALARDAVLKDVDTGLIEDMHLLSFKTKCRDRGEHLTRPDLGRQFEKSVMEEIKAKCIMNPQVQIFLSDGLSGQAIEANGPHMLPVLLDCLEGYKIKTGTPFFVKFGRVPSMDVISELLKAEVTCVLIGERPGLATANSMSAYIAYRAEVGMPEARRTVVSNIHADGIPAVEAGAYVADVIKKILEAKQSGVDLRF